MKNRYSKCGIARFIAILLLPAITAKSQTTYDDFEGIKQVTYSKNRTGVLDTLALNPAPDSVNNSEKCGKYIRNRAQKFDNIKMSVNGKLLDVSPFATYEGLPPRLKLKVYTTAPPGTLVEILLGSRGRNNEYPAGTHSQYQAYTTTSNKWEVLEFKFSQIPVGSQTGASDIDQITLLFFPNSNTSDTWYFDDMRGPQVVKTTPAPPLKQKPVTSKKK